MRLKSYCWIGLTAYGLLSVADLVLTFALLESNRSAYESNPAAAAFLERFGWTGLALYKAAGVSVFVAAVVLLLLRRRPKIGAGLVTFGCVVLLAVNTYTHKLIAASPQEESETVVGGWETERESHDNTTSWELQRPVGGSFAEY